MILYALFSVITLLLFVAALVDIITRNDSQVQHLPKLVWILIVVLLPFIGSVLWFIIGREWPVRQPGQHRPRTSARDTWATHPSPSALTTEEQLARLDREIAEAEANARIRELEAEIERRRRERGAGAS